MKKKVFALMLTLCMVLTMMPSMAWADGGSKPPMGLSVEYNGNYITEGVIEIEEGGLCEMPIYFDGKQVESTEGIADPMAEPPANGICFPGVSPDGKAMEIRMGGTANEGETCEVPLTYRGKTITLTVRVVAGIRLKFEDNTVMKTGRNITGRKMATAQIMFGEKEITENYTVSAKSSAVLKVENKGQGKLKFTTTGNGKSDIVISYQKDEKNCESTFIWNGTDISNDDAGAHNVALQINGIEKKTGEVIVLAPNKSVTGKVLHNGNELNKYDVEVVYNDWEEERECSAEKSDNNKFTIVTGNKESYYTLKITDDKDRPSWEAHFTIQVRNEPDEYVLQFCDMEKQSDENWEALGYGTISIFKNIREKKYVKYVITDGKMKRIDEDYFVKVNPETDIDVQVCVGGDNYEKVQDNENPFSFNMVNDGSGVMEISYDRRKDRKGLAYRLYYTGNDPYLSDALGKTVHKSIFLWTRSVADFLKWDSNKFEKKDNHWKYDARKTSYEGFEASNDKCDIKNASIFISNDIFGQDKINIVQDKTTMEVQTNLATVTFDDKILTKIDAEDHTVTLNIENIEAEDVTDANVANNLKGATKIVDLTLETEADNGTISNFEDGVATINLGYQLQDASKKPQVYYVDAVGNKTAVDCNYNTETGELTFDTNHFSMYSVEEVNKTSGGGTSGGSSSGGGGFVTPAETPLDKAKTEANTAISAAASANKYDDAEQAEVKAILDKAAADIKNAKTEEEVKAIREAAQAEIDKVLTTEEKAQIKAVGSVDKEIFKAKSKYSKLRGKRAIKLTWNIPDGMKFDGFEIYRSTKKFSGYGKTPYFTTTKTSYINSKDLVKGKTYYYKVRAFVIINGEKFYTDYSTKAFRTMK